MRLPDHLRPRMLIDGEIVFLDQLGGGGGHKAGYEPDYETKPCGFITSAGGHSIAPREQKRVPIAGEVDFATLGVTAPALQGVACRYTKVHRYKGRLEAFMPGCFSASLTSGDAIRVMVMHEPVDLFATTRDRLALAEDGEGLYFRVGLSTDSDAQRDLAIKVATGEFSEMSVGYAVEREHVRVIDGNTIHCLTECRLHEISIVNRGAVPGTRVVLIDGARRPSLRDDIRRGELFRSAVSATQAKSDAAYARLEAAMHNLCDCLSTAIENAAGME